MKIRDYITDLDDCGYVSEGQDIADAAPDLDADTTEATGRLKELLLKANGKVYCELGF
uniref:Uncharacterized protein n=1 Tax=viral metagenome TaxID=1070528 RepID=A0A6H1ZZH0_9ZZZZ